MENREPTFRAFRAARPDSRNFAANGKQKVTLGRTDRMVAVLQVLKGGGADGNSLHSHGSLDGFWMVLKGRVRFYGRENTVLGEYGPMEGVVLPRNFAYWFESVGDEESELLQVEAFHVPIPVGNDDFFREDRTDLEPRKAHQTRT